MKNIFHHLTSGRVVKSVSVLSALSAAAVIASFGIAHAGEGPPSEARQQSAQLNEETHPSEDGSTSSKNRFLGRAPWICTPSGFGQTASCFRRTGLRSGID